MQRLTLLVSCLAILGAPGSAHAQTVPSGFTVQARASALSFPCGFDFLPDGRILYVEQFSGRLRVFQDGAGVQSTAVLTVMNLSATGERGLLGVASDPAWPAKPYVYLYYDVASPNHIRIARYTLSGNLDGTGGNLLGDPASRLDLVDEIPDNATNHNGGTLRFGPDRMLYASCGEDAVPCGAQDSTSLRGVILRLRTGALGAGPGRALRADVTPADNPFAADPDTNTRLLAALGLRNPFRFQVDLPTGCLVIGDVGENLREEIDLLGGIAPSLPLAAPLGADFGWPYLEGTLPGAHRNDCGPIPSGLTAPIFDYDRTQQANAAIISAGCMRVVPGGVRSWPAAYDGDLFASDYYSGVLRHLAYANGAWALASTVPGQSSATAWGTGFAEISDWRLGPDGALWFCRQAVGGAANTGSIGRIAGPGSTAVPWAASPLRLALVRSPALGRARLSVTGATRVRIADVAGRAIRVLYDRAGPAIAAETIEWDGRDDAGRPVAPGIYVAVAEGAGRARSVVVPFLR